MATKKRKARGGELWAVIDTRTGKIQWLHGQRRLAVEKTKADAQWWLSYAFYGDFKVQRILWRPAPARRRAKR